MNAGLRLDIHEAAQVIGATPHSSGCPRLRHHRAQCSQAAPNVPSWLRQRLDRCAKRPQPRTARSASPGQGFPPPARNSRMAWRSHRRNLTTSEPGSSAPTTTNTAVLVGSGVRSPFGFATCAKRLWAMLSEPLVKRGHVSEGRGRWPQYFCLEAGGSEAPVLLLLCSCQSAIPYSVAFQKRSAD